MGGASDDHVIIGHVTIPEAISTAFGQLISVREKLLSFITALRETRAWKFFSENFPYTRKP